jgi:Arc/MetJ family transcription regulator
MRITIDIDEQSLAEVMKFTGESKKGPAVVKAATDFLRRKKVSDYARRVMEGEFPDYPLTNDEIEACDR